MEPALVDVGIYVVLGFLGGVLYCLITKVMWTEEFEWARRMVVGAVAGGIAYYLGITNLVMVLVWGYFGVDIVEAIIHRKSMGSIAESVMENMDEE